MATQRTKIKTKYLFRNIGALILALIASGMFYYTWYRFVVVHNLTGSLTGIGNLGMAVGIYFILFTAFGHWLHAFNIGNDRKIVALPSMALTILVVDILEVFISCAITGQFRFFGAFLGRYLVLALVQIVVLALLVSLMIDLYRKLFPPLLLVSIYGDHRNELHEKMNLRRDKYKIKKMIHVNDALDHLDEIIPAYDGVLINDVPTAAEHVIVKKCYEVNKRVYYAPKLSDIIVKNAAVLNIFDTPLFVNRNDSMAAGKAFVKRLFDIVSSLAALIVLSPVLLITAAAIKLEDGGPVFYKQTRVTKDMKPFEIVKFRSMIVDAEKAGAPQLATDNDERITKVGRVIRATRIDELPQLINILKGDMSVVGPRPERPEYVKMFIAEIPEFRYRYKVRGGLTGYAQIYGKYNTTPLDKLKLDLMYILDQSFLVDLQIILSTLKVLVNRESTEGFSKDHFEEPLTK